MFGETLYSLREFAEGLEKGDIDPGEINALNRKFITGERVKVEEDNTVSREKVFYLIVGLKLKDHIKYAEQNDIDVRNDGGEFEISPAIDSGKDFLISLYGSSVTMKVPRVDENNTIEDIRKNTLELANLQLEGTKLKAEVLGLNKEPLQLEIGELESEQMELAGAVV